MNIYSAKENPPPPEERKFPMEVRHRKSASVMIYESPNRGTLMYTIAYPCDGQRQRSMRRDFEEAFAFAKEIALKMSDGTLNFLTLDGKERFVYERALELAAKTAMELDALVSRAVEASDIAGGPDHLIAAARLYESQRRGVVHKMVSEVVVELIENRRSSNASELYLRDLRVRLENRFALAFKVRISSVTTGDIQRFLDGLKCKPRTKKNFLTTIGTLFSFAQNKGYVPETHPGISKVEFKSNDTTKIDIFTTVEMETLLNNARPELVPVLAIGAFAGLRSEEIKRLEWTNVHFKGKFIEVGAEIAKNRTRRVVHMTDNLCRWLGLNASVQGRANHIRMRQKMKPLRQPRIAMPRGHAVQSSLWLPAMHRLPTHQLGWNSTRAPSWCPAKVIVKAKQLPQGSGRGNLNSRLMFADKRWQSLDLCIHGQQLCWHCAECDQYFKEREKPKPKKRKA